MHTLVKQVQAAEIARLIDGPSAKAFESMLDDIVDWCDELGQRLEAKS